MAKIFGKWLKYRGQGLNISGTVYVFEVRHRYVAFDLSILNMASMRGKRLKYLRNHFTILEMTCKFDNRLIYVGNEVYIWEMA